MNPIIKDFHTGVYNQAISAGKAHDVASLIADAALLDRVKKSDAGFGIAQAADVQPRLYYTFHVNSVRVDQSAGGGMVLDAVLVTPGEDSGGQFVDQAAIQEFADSINSADIAGFADPKHSTWRVEKQRISSNGITEWVKARVEDGQVWITAKIKAGYEWIVHKFPYLSMEAAVPANKFVKDGKLSRILGGAIRGFVFTDQPKNYLNRIVTVTNG